MLASELYSPCGPQCKNQRKRKESQEFIPCQRTKKNITENENDRDSSTLRTVPKGLIRELKELQIGGRADVFQTTAMLWSVKILSRILETWGILLSLRLQSKTISLCSNKKLVIISIWIFFLIEEQNNAISSH